MAHPINVGVDFGSLGWRAACRVGAQTIIVFADERDALPGLRLWYEPSPSAGISTTFSSLKSKIGTSARLPVNGGARGPDELLAEDLRALRTRIEAQASETVGQVVISVPANYSASRRTALRDAALKAGFADAHLLNDSMAAVILYTDQSQEAATLLVYSMGYAGFEIGLVRVARGRYRTLAYESGKSPCGAAWDELFLQSWLTCFPEHNLVLDPPPKQWSAAQWLQVRLAAQQVKETLSQADEASFPILTKSGDSPNPFSVRFFRTDVEKAVAPSVNVTLEITEKILAEANLTAQDVDAFLLVGGSTRNPLVPALLEKRFDKKPVTLDAEALAKGSALYAMRLETSPLPTTPLNEAIEAPPETGEIPVVESAIIATVTNTATTQARFPSGAWLTAAPLPERRVSSARPQHDVLTARKVVLQYVRHLIEQGESSKAKLFIQKLGQDAYKLFSEVHPVTQPATHHKSERAISQADQLLKEGKLEEAVRHSHLAWQLMPDSPDIFDRMIDIHCQAAMSNTDIESYVQSCRWLKCAHSHDQSNTRTREALAERHYLQAKQLVERGRRKEARTAIEQCLHWNPEHEKGKELNAALG